MFAVCLQIRVNPGNFMDGAKKFDDDKIYTDEEYEAELEAIEELFTPLVLKCKELGRAIRIGTNHGSLSARTLARSPKLSYVAEWSERHLLAPQ